RIFFEFQASWKDNRDILLPFDRLFVLLRPPLPKLFPVRQHLEGEKDKTEAFVKSPDIPANPGFHSQTEKCCTALFHQFSWFVIKSGPPKGIYKHQDFAP